MQEYLKSLMNIWTVLKTHFVTNYINYTYSKNVGLWPMSLAPSNEGSGGTQRKTVQVKNPSCGHMHEEQPFGKKTFMYVVTYTLCEGSI